MSGLTTKHKSLMPADVNTFEEVLYHQGSHRDFEERLEAFLEDPQREHNLTADGDTLRRLVNDERNLHLAFNRVRQQGEKATGPDGIRLSEFSAGALPELLRLASEILADHSYFPGPARKAKIAKADGKLRTLFIRNSADRVIAKAYQQVLSPLLDRTFTDISHGGRPGRGRETALSEAIYFANCDDRWCWVGIDLRDAFNGVPLGKLDQILQQVGFTDRRFREMILRIAKATDKKGLQQGCALSPLLFNVYLDRALDRHWQTTHPDIPMLRYLDDVMLICKDNLEANKALEDLQSLLIPAELEIKESKTQQVDLKTTIDSIDWLGYRISLRNGGNITPTDAAWRKLGGYFEDNGEALSPNDTASHIRGWIRAMGPGLGPQARQQLGGRLSSRELHPMRESYRRHSQEYQHASVRAYLRWRARMWWALVSKGMTMEGSASPNFLTEYTLRPAGQVPLPALSTDFPSVGWSVVIQTHPKPTGKRKHWVALVIDPQHQLVYTLADTEQADRRELPFIALDEALGRLQKDRKEVHQLTVISSDQQFVETTRALYELDRAESQPKTDDRYWNRPKFWDRCRGQLEQLGCREFNTQSFVTPYDPLLWNEQMIVSPEDRAASPAM